MILNDKYNFLFVHIQKTAGSSITNVLNSLEFTYSLNHSHSFITSVEYKYDSYFKFTFVRNPWDRLVSWYNMMLNKSIHNDFSRYLLNNSTNFSQFLNLTEIINETNEHNDFIKTDYPKSIAFNQLDYISDNKGNVLMDFIGKFENLENDFRQIMEKIGVKDYSLLHLNKFEHGDYRNYYTDEDIEKVYKIYKRDIEYFNYKF